MQSGKQRHDCLKKENSGMLAIYSILQRELSGSGKLGYVPRMRYGMSGD